MKDLVTIADKTMESAPHLMDRLGMGETALYSAVKNKVMPAPIKIAGKRYFDMEEVDRCLLRRS